MNIMCNHKSWLFKGDQIVQQKLNSTSKEFSKDPIIYITQWDGPDERIFAFKDKIKKFFSLILRKFSIRMEVLESFCLCPKI